MYESPPTLNQSFSVQCRFSLDSTLLKKKKKDPGLRKQQEFKNRPENGKHLKLKDVFAEKASVIQVKLLKTSSKRLLTQSLGRCP